MNATSLYVSTCRAMLGGSAETGDLFRLLPYLRAALSCAVCGGLLRRAASPPNGACPHAVCRGCRAGRKRLKPACAACRDLRRYADNRQLRILLQSYKKLCEYFIGTSVYSTLSRQTEEASKGLVDLIKEGAGFSDGYQSTAGLTKSAYQILPCVYTNSSTQTQTQQQQQQQPSAAEEDSPAEEDEQPSVASSSSRAAAEGSSPLYSVSYAGTAGTKITIKRKPPDEDDGGAQPPLPQPPKDAAPTQAGFKKPTYRSRNSAGKKKGCRCGNATATPGKLTCCGQRCPCYVESKPCNECKCKGCRNPHRADGLKVRPHIPELDNNYKLVQIKQENSPSGSGSVDAESYEIIDFNPNNIKTDMDAYTSRLQEVSADLPAAIMMDEDVSQSSQPSDEESGGSPGLRDSGGEPPVMAARRSQALPTNMYGVYASPPSDSQENSDVEVDV